MSRAASRAIISVFDKTGAADLACFLAEQGCEILSSGGTARHLQAAGLEIIPVEQVSGYPELLDGRVKTLHPAVHAGILARRGQEKDLEDLERHGIVPVDWVAVNLYPFQQALEEGFGEAALREYIDIGGPTLLRAAAKNYPDVVVLCDPADYSAVMEEYRREGGVSADMRCRLARKVFSRIADYDRLIARHIGNSSDLLGGDAEEYSE